MKHGLKDDVSDDTHRERMFYLRRARYNQNLLEGKGKNYKAPSFNRKQRNGFIEGARELFSKKQ